MSLCCTVRKDFLPFLVLSFIKRNPFEINPRILRMGWRSTTNPRELFFNLIPFQRWCKLPQCEFFAVFVSLWNLLTGFVLLGNACCFYCSDARLHLLENFVLGLHCIYFKKNCVLEASVQPPPAVLCCGHSRRPKGIYRSRLHEAPNSTGHWAFFERSIAADLIRHIFAAATKKTTSSGISKLLR